jgi:anti-sigma regulatory factor (Ser/Thr protein kinase)
VEHALTFPATYLAVRDALDWLATRLADAGLADLTDEVSIATAEALTNVCRHAYGEGVVGDIDLRFEPSATGCRVTVRDRGRPPPPHLFNRAQDVSTDRPEGGMGLSLILAVAQSVTLDRTAEQTCLRMTFQSPPAEGASPLV